MLRKLRKRISDVLRILSGKRCFVIFPDIRLDDTEAARGATREMAWLYLWSQYGDDGRNIASRLHLLDGVLNPDVPYIHFSKSTLSGETYVSACGTDEELTVLRNLECNIDGDEEDDE